MRSESSATRSKRGVVREVHTSLSDSWRQPLSNCGEFQTFQPMIPHFILSLLINYFMSSAAVDQDYSTLSVLGASSWVFIDNA